MTEALRIALEIQDGLTPESSLPLFSEIPYHLKKSTLKQIRRENGEVPEILWEERGTRVERRVAEILRGQTDIVSQVSINPRYTQGSDLRVEFVESFVLPEIRVEVKSSNLGIKEYKQKIRDKLFTEEDNGQLTGPWTNELATAEWNALHSQAKEQIISGWLTKNKIILINGSEEKTVEEILTDSFYPQLERMKLKALQNGNSHEPTQLFP